MTFFLSSKSAKPRAKKAGAARANMFRHNIEGEMLTSTQIAKRLGLKTPESANERLKRCEYPPTWEKLYALARRIEDRSPQPAAESSRSPEESE